MNTYKIEAVGLVQGVGYRNFTAQIAKSMGLNGYVKNLDNGDVEILINLESSKLGDFLDSLHKGNGRMRTDYFRVFKLSQEDLEDFRVVR